MESDIDIKKLWKEQTVLVTEGPRLSKEIRSFKTKRMFELIVLNIILLITICFVIVVWMYFESQLVITKIGLVLAILSISVVLVFNCKIIPLYSGVSEVQSNLDYLNKLLAVKHKEHFMQTKLMSFYFISLSLGIGCYMYEYVLKSSLLFGIIAYSSFFLWVGLNWFVFRPKIISRKRQKIDHLIKHVEKIRLQLSQSEHSV